MAAQQHGQFNLAADAIAEVFVTQRCRAGTLQEQVCGCTSGDLRLTLLAPGLLIVTENLLRASEAAKPLGLVCYPQPPSSERPEFPVQLTVQGRQIQLQFWSPKAVHQWLAAPERAQVPVLPPPSERDAGASPTVHGNLALQGCTGCSQARQLDLLADEVALRIGDFAAALVTAADAELVALKMVPSRTTSVAAAAASDSPVASSYSSCAGTGSVQHPHAPTGEEAAAAEVLAAYLAGQKAEPALVSPFGRFAAANASGVSRTSLAMVTDEGQASRRGSADDAGMLLFGDDNFAGAGLRRRNLSAALTPRSADRSPRPGPSPPFSPPQQAQALTMTATRQESGTYYTSGSSGRRGSGDSRLGQMASASAASVGRSASLPPTHAGMRISDSMEEAAAADDLSSSRRQSLQVFLLAQLELLGPQLPASASAEAAAPPLQPASPRSQPPLPRPPLQQSSPPHRAVLGDPAVAASTAAEQEESGAPLQTAATASSSKPLPAAAAEAAADALESAASALREGAASATAAAADALPPTGELLQAGAAAGAAVGAVAALAVTAPVIAPAATEAVKAVVSDAATSVVSSAVDTATAAASTVAGSAAVAADVAVDTAAAAVSAAADAAASVVPAAASNAATACAEVATAAAGPMAEGAAAVTCQAAEAAGGGAGPVAQTAADVVCSAAETVADTAVPAASTPAAALVSAAGAAAAGLAGLAIREDASSLDTQSTAHSAAVSASLSASQPAAHPPKGEVEDEASGSDQQAGAMDHDSPASPRLKGLRGGAQSSSFGNSSLLAASLNRLSSQADADGRGGGVNGSRPARGTKLGRRTPFADDRNSRSIHPKPCGKDQTACCGAAGTGSCGCDAALSSPWLIFQDSVLERRFCRWQGRSQLQMDSVCCMLVLLVCLGVGLAPRVLAAALVPLVPYAVLSACLAALPLILMWAMLPWYLDHREAVLQGIATALVAVCVGAATAHLRAICDAAARAL